MQCLKNYIPSSGPKISETLLTKSKQRVEELQTKLVAKTEELMEAQKTWMEVRESLRKTEDEVQRKERRLVLCVALYYTVKPVYSSNPWVRPTVAVIKR